MNSNEKLLRRLGFKWQKELNSFNHEQMRVSMTLEAVKYMNHPDFKDALKKLSPSARVDKHN